MKLDLLIFPFYLIGDSEDEFRSFLKIFFYFLPIFKEIRLSKFGAFHKKTDNLSDYQF